MTRSEIDCPECNGEGLVECAFYGSYNTGQAKCPRCEGAGTVYTPIPQLNVLPVSALTASNELPF